jgi:hypothetical protein
MDGQAGVLSRVQYVSYENMVAKSGNWNKSCNGPKHLQYTSARVLLKTLVNRAGEDVKTW